MKFTLDRHNERGGHVEARVFVDGALAGHLVLRASEGERLDAIFRRSSRPAADFTSEGDEKIFRGWLERVKAGLGPLEVTADDESPRMALIQEIHADVGDRFPLGIAEQLNNVITCLHVDLDEEAIGGLEDLINTEVRARELNGTPSSLERATEAFQEGGQTS